MSTRRTLDTTDDAEIGLRAAFRLYEGAECSVLSVVTVVRM